MLKHWTKTILLLGLMSVTGLAQVESVPTKVMVRAVSRDAKILHDGVGGALITIKDTGTGKILAQGTQKGTSGDTAKIMRLPHARGAAVYDTAGAAGFVATINLSVPTVVEIIAEGPLNAPQAKQRASKTMLLVPGQDVLGEGILLEIHGFIVTLQKPTPETPVRAGEPFSVRVTATMSCGCPTEPGGIWDANKFKLTAYLRQRGKIVAESPLTYAGSTSTYEGQITSPRAGQFTLEVLAIDAANANFGQFRQTVLVLASQKQTNSRI